jgi:hypothetical protein
VTLDLRTHAAHLAQRVASTGADLAQPRIRYTRDDLEADVSIRGDLPGSGIPKSSQVDLTERWVRPFRDQPWRLVEYAYELLDHERDVRFALHLHDQDWYVDNLRVVVHEHCDSPIGNVRCRHYAGDPIAGGHEAVDRLLEVWTRDAPLDCAALTCLERT